MRFYLADKMVGVPYFNAPWFDLAASVLRQMHDVTEVFNPAEHDREQGFHPENCPHGSEEEAEAAGFVRRNALRDDWTWIAEKADGVIVGPLWRYSRGAISEAACAQALGLPVYEYHAFTAGRRTRVAPIMGLPRE